MKKLWVSFGALLVVSFSVLGWIGTRIYQEMPPIPDRIVTTDGAEIFASGEVGRGQNVWQSLGGMQVGSIWGHGSYVAPDWTADWLHREAMFVLEEWSARDYAKPYAQLSGEQQAGLQGRLQTIFRTNTYDAASNSIRIDPARARAIEKCVSHYNEIFRQGNVDYAIPPGAVSSPERLRQLTAFIFWSAWSSAANRPGETISYTNNWPHEPLLGNRPTGDAVMWTGVSILMLLAGICAMVWWYASQKEVDDHGPISPIDPLGEWKATSSQLATLKYFWVVALLILVQILVGVVTAHYGVEGDGFYGFKIADDPALLGHPHLARPTRHLLDRHRLARRRPLHRAPRQRCRTQVPDPRRQRPVRRPAPHRRRLHVRPMDEYHEPPLRRDQFLLGPSGL
jgi:nitric oxide reductase subunit B